MCAAQAVFVYSVEQDRYSYPADCPFNTTRAGKTYETVKQMGLLDGDRRVAAPERASAAELETFHDSAYLVALQRAEAGDLSVDGLSMGLGTPDCPIFRGLWDYASLAAGASLMAARLILTGTVDVAFNPSGGYHHAGPVRAAGFCYLNDVVLAILALTAAGRRVLFLDLDVHHGDGVQAAFYDRADVMTLSLHESGRTLFPGTGFVGEIGTGAGRGYSVNFPLPVGTYDQAYEGVFVEAAWPLMCAYAPDVIVVELGMDGLAGDPLAHLHLTNNVYADILTRVLELDRPILATGGGGYNVENTVRGWALAWSTLTGAPVEDLALGMGGTMLENTDWHGGLRDRMLISDAGARNEVDRDIAAMLDDVRAAVFPLHGLAG